MKIIDRSVRHLLAKCPQPLYQLLKWWKYRNLSEKLSAYAGKRRPPTGQIPCAGATGKTLSIVVPCYNHSGFLEDTFHSLMSQTCKYFDLILIDDQSSDGTAEVLPAYASRVVCRSSKILTNEKNMGQAASINRAVETAGTSHVMILNDDDYLMHDAVEYVLSIMDGYPHLHMIGSPFSQYDSQSVPIRKLDDGQKKISERYGVCTDEIDIEMVLPEALLSSADVVNRYDISHTGCTFTKYAWETVGGYYPLAKRFVSYTDRDFQIRVASCFPVGRIKNCALNFWRTYSSLDNSLNS